MWTYCFVNCVRMILLSELPNSLDKRHQKYVISPKLTFKYCISKTYFLRQETARYEDGSGGCSSSVAQKRTTKDGFGGIICESSNWQGKALCQLRLNQSGVVPQCGPDTPNLWVNIVTYLTSLPYYLSCFISSLCSLRVLVHLHFSHSISQNRISVTFIS